MPPKKDNNQDVKIAQLQQWSKDFEIRQNEKFANIESKFDRFTSNEFEHLRQKVDWILWIFILGTLISIAITLWK